MLCALLGECFMSCVRACFVSSAEHGKLSFPQAPKTQTARAALSPPGIRKTTQSSYFLRRAPVASGSTETKWLFGIWVSAGGDVFGLFGVGLEEAW